MVSGYILILELEPLTEVLLHYSTSVHSLYLYSHLTSWLLAVYLEVCLLACVLTVYQQPVE